MRNECLFPSIETDIRESWFKLRNKCILFKDSNSTFFFGGIVFPLHLNARIFLTYAQTPDGWFELAYTHPLSYPIDFNNVFSIQEPEIGLKVSDPVLPELVSRYGIVQRRVVRARLFYPFDEINTRYQKNQLSQLIEMRADQKSVRLVVFSSSNFDYLIPGLANYFENLNNALAEFIRINGGRLPLRMDSACISGQIYNDHGCDCKWQLQQALRNGFLVIHDPFADGRGWGIIPKNITELFKSGIRDPRLDIDYPERPLNTVEAAKFLYERLGLPIDIRGERYREMGRELGELLRDLPMLPSVISVFTDNEEKIRCFSEGLNFSGVTISLEAIPTNSASHCDYCRSHIYAKHTCLPQYK